MDIDNLVRMANRIGDFFAAYPDKDEAEASIAKHIELFWTPQMRRELIDHLATCPSGHRLQARVVGAVSHHLARPAADPGQ
jgi:formate dehydrogenase subunit delta